MIKVRTSNVGSGVALVTVQVLLGETGPGH